MKILIIEDEIHNQRLLQGMISELKPDWEVAGKFVSVKETVKWLKNNPAPHLIFMDIQLVDGLCFSIFSEVKIETPVIFTTAYDEYAIQAFKVNSIDYLLKPIKEEELFSAIEKFEKIIAIVKKEGGEIDVKNLLEAIKSGKKEYRKRFLISKGDAFIKIETANVAYFNSENKITTLVTLKNEKHVIDFTLEKLEEELNPMEFYRANRQFIISLHSIRKIETYFGGKFMVKLIQPFDEKITISRLKATDFKNWIDQ